MLVYICKETGKFSTIAFLPLFAVKRHSTALLFVVVPLLDLRHVQTEFAADLDFLFEIPVRVLFKKLEQDGNLLRAESETLTGMPVATDLLCVLLTDFSAMLVVICECSGRLGGF